MMTMKQMWENYKAHCVPKDAGEIQIKLTENAFYAGFIAMFTVNEHLSKPEVTELQGVLLLEEISKEINQYLKRKREQAASQAPN